MIESQQKGVMVEFFKRRIFRLEKFIVSSIQSTSIHKLFGIVPYLLSSSAIASILIAVIQMVFQGGGNSVSWVIWISTIAIACAIVFKVLGGWWEKKISTLQDFQIVFIKSFIWSFFLACLGLILVSYLAVWTFPAHLIDWRRYGYLDKRWLFGLYWIVVFSVFVIPTFFYRVLTTTKYTDQKTNEPKERSYIPQGSSPKFKKRIWSIALISLLISSLFFGPPWNISRTSPEVNIHEQVHLGPLQAIDNGYLIGVGSGAQQYGPGTQQLAHYYMKLTDHFSVVGLREFHGLVHFIGFAIFCFIAFGCLDKKMALLTIFLALFVSPFALVGWNTLGGFLDWGWPNPYRSLGALVVVIAAPFLLINEKPRFFSFLLGVFWGGMCWISPENLLIGVMGNAILIPVLWGMKVITLKRILDLFVFILTGFLFSWLPIIIFYSLNDSLQSFLFSYSLIGSQVIKGFSNTPVSEKLISSPAACNIFYYSIPFTLLLGLSVQYTNFKLRKPNWNQVLFLTFVSISIAGFFSVLTRSDPPHLYNSLIGFPFLLVASYKFIPDTLTHKKWHKLLLRATFSIAILLFSFGNLNNFAPFISKVRNPIIKYFPIRQTTENRKFPGESNAAIRLGFDSVSRDALFKTDPPIAIKDLIDEMNFLHAYFGDQTVYIHSFPFAEPSFVYFLADLNQSPLYLEPSLMIFSSDLKEDFIDDFKIIIGEVDNIITKDISIEEVEIYIRFHKNAVIDTRFFNGNEYFIIHRQAEP